MTDFKIKAVIFDLDGLVLDSEATYISAWRQAAAELGCLLDDAFCRSLSGMHGAAVERKMIDLCGAGFEIARFNRLSGEIWTAQVKQNGIPVKKGFFTLLKVIESLTLPFALATNSRRQDAEYCLEVAGLGGVFPVVIARDEVTIAKPAPDIFLAAAGALGFRPEECLALEDSPIGVVAASAAGSYSIYIPSIYPADNDAIRRAGAVMEDLEDVAAYLEALHCPD